MSNKGRPKERLDVRARFTRLSIPGGGSPAFARRLAGALWTQWLATGDLPRGVELDVEWRNPNNKNPRHANWKSSTDSDQSLEAARDTLDRGGWLSAAEIDWTGGDEPAGGASDGLPPRPPTEPLDPGDDEDDARKARSARAKRGWETRRRTARSARAKRGWETRRRTARSARAKRRAKVTNRRKAQHK
jgi:hypothetical protein